MTDRTKMFDMTGRSAVVIGAGSGIGRSVADCLSQFGARVIVADRDTAGVEETAQQITDAGGVVEAGTVDMTDPSSVAHLVDHCGTTTDVLVMTAAMHCRKPVAGFTEDDVDRVLDLNVKSAFRVMRSFAATMAQRGGGSIVTFSSIRATVHEPGTSVYGASKAAVTSLVKGLATEYGRAGVRVNTIAPSPVETPMTAGVKANPAWYEAYANKTVLGRWALPHDLLGPVMLLVSDAGSFITGTELLVDGGWLAADGRFDPPLD